MHSSAEDTPNASSGDLRADQRLEMALQLRARGDVAAAADLIAQALELAPTWPAGLFAHAETLALAGDTSASIAAYRRYLEADPSDVMGAAARLHLLSGGAPPELSAAYVRRLFDQYAPRFDKSLRDGLKYQAPDQLRRLIEESAPARRFGRVLDLGCGTGLMAEALADISKTIDGVDLSPGMIAEARRKNIYASLNVTDLRTALTSARGYDLIVAADVLNYVRDLAPVISSAATALAPGGLFAFTVESDDAEAVSLGPTQRFRHSAKAVESTARTCHFHVRAARPSFFRQEADKPVPGLLILLQK